MGPYPIQLLYRRDLCWKNLLGREKPRPIPRGEVNVKVRPVSVETESISRARLPLRTR
jgi:hypothetical protein